MHHRFPVFVSAAALVSLVLLFGLQYSSLDTQRLKEWIPDWRHHGDEEYRYRPSNITSDVVEEQGANSSLPKMMLVLATLSYTDNSWVDEQLGDLLGEDGNLYTAIYVVNNEDAPLHTPKNKGHEAMAYLSYIIDFYDSLPEISVFMHGHATAWHNNYLLQMSSSLIIRYLNREKIVREGYMNLRCHWSPGCPSHLHPQETEFDVQKQEEIRIKDAWGTLFPTAPLPEVLSQPCCSQFAVSRAAIQRMPREKYIEIRDWLLDTPLDDYVSGRIFEYLWQYMFNETPVFCPDPRICYCDGYGACFEDPNEYNAFFEQVTEMDKYRKELEAWENWKKDKNMARNDGIVDGGPDAGEEGQEVRITWLEEQLQKIADDLWERKEAAFEAGKDPRRRAAAINAVRNLTIENPKDGPPYWTKRDLSGDGMDGGW